MKKSRTGLMPRVLALALLLQLEFAHGAADQAAWNLRARGYVDSSVSSLGTSSSLPVALTNPSGIKAIADWRRAYLRQEE